MNLTKRPSAPTRPVRRIGITLAIIAGCAASTSGLLFASTASASFCAGKRTTFHGHRAFISCGPATATLTIAGHTYHFRGGSCIRSGSTLSLGLGETVIGAGAGNGGKPSFEITVSGKSADLAAAMGGRDLMQSGLALVKVPGGAAPTGRFYGKLITAKAEPVTGMWNCH